VLGTALVLVAVLVVVVVAVVPPTASAFFPVVAFVTLEVLGAVEVVFVFA